MFELLFNSYLKNREFNCLFEICWVKSGHVVMKAANGKYLTAAATGHMRAVSENITDMEIFRISLVNRPILVLKCEYGLVGYKNKTSYKLECNKSTFNVIMLEESENGCYHLKGNWFFVGFLLVGSLENIRVFFWLNSRIPRLLLGNWIGQYIERKQ